MTTLDLTPLRMAAMVDGRVFLRSAGAAYALGAKADGGRQPAAPDQ